MITVVGSLNYDLIIRTPHLPKPGQTIHGHDFRTACGGKGANQAYAVARMGQPALMIGCVGADAFGAEMVANLQDVGIDTSGIARRDGMASGIAMILVEASGQNEIVIAAGANGTHTVEDVQRHADRIRASEAVITQLETTLAASDAALTLAHAAGRLTVLNPAPYSPVSDALLGQCDYIIPNESEAAAMTGIEVNDVNSAARAATALKARGVRNVLVTLGAGGVWLDTENWQGHVPAFEVQAVDTVAAGDTFIGAFVTRLVEGASPHEAARFGCAASAISVTRPGAQPSIPARAEVETFLSQRGG
jgi:ribokinase